MGPEPSMNLFVNKHSFIWPKRLTDLAEFWVLICVVHLTVCSWHVTWTFQSESTFYICLNVKELLTQNRRHIWSLSDCNGTQTLNQLDLKGTLKHLAKLTKWLSWIVSTYLYGAFECMFLSNHLRVSDWIQTLSLRERQGKELVTRKWRDI